MLEFWKQIGTLLIFTMIVNLILGSLLVYIGQTPIGSALIVVSWMALGWYWSRIYDFTKMKIKNFISSKQRE